MSDAPDQPTAVWMIRRGSPETTDTWFSFQHPTITGVGRQQLPGLPANPTILDDREALLAVHVLPGAATPYDLQKQIETWVREAGGADDLYLEVVSRSTRVLWRDGRCVVVAPADQADEGLAAAALFTFVIREFHHQESALEASWSNLAGDVDLTHEVRSVDLARQAHVNKMTAMFQTARIWIARSEIALQRPASFLGSNGRRLFLELVLLADLEGRLRLIDDATEVGEDLYERANDRMIEKRSFIVELRVEVAILVAIVAELVVLLLEYRHF